MTKRAFWALLLTLAVTAPLAAQESKPAESPVTPGEPEGEERITVMSVSR